jgi:hypothetical protein
MAPEFPPRLVVFTLTKDGDSIASEIENVELDPRVNSATPLPVGRLRVRWSEVEPPPGFRSVGSGALYVEESDSVKFDGPRSTKLDFLENNRFRWIQGTPPGIPWIMIAVIFPVGHSLGRPRPAPTSAKNFNDRVAIYWCLKGDSDGRAQVEWDLCPQVRSTDEEVRFLNSHSSLEEVPSAAGIDIDAAPAPKAPRSVSVFLCHSSQDKPLVRELHAQLKQDGFAPWLDSEDILPGEEWEAAIRHAVRSSHVVLVCLSQGSVSKAGFLQRELRFALQVAEEQPEGTIFIIPLRLEDCTVPEALSRWQWLNHFEVGAYGRLLSALRKRASQLQPI